MRYLILGGAGFIGRNLVAALQKSGHQVSILDNFSFSDPLDNPEAKTFTGDALNESIVASCVNSFNPDVVIWALAFHAYMPGTDPIIRNCWNAYGLARILPAIGHLKSRKFVLLSSDLVYKPADKPLKENSQLNWGNPKFSISHAIIMEWYTTSICRSLKLPFCIARLPYVVGKRRYSHVSIDPIGFFIDAMIHNNNLLVTDSQQKRDYICLDNVMEMLVNVVSQEKFYGAYNISSGVGISNADIIQSLIDITTPEVLPSLVASKESHYILDNKKILDLGQTSIEPISKILVEIYQHRQQLWSAE